MTKQSLQDVLDGVPNIVDYLYNDTPGPHGRTKPGLSPVPIQHTNWREEQQAWRESAVLFDQSHHMPELYLRGSDARRLLSLIGINDLSNLRPGLAKQLVGCSPDGHIIGDCVLHDLGDDTYQLISGQTLLNWVQFNAETGDYDITTERDEATWDNPKGRRNFRFGMDGPNAREIFRRVVEDEAPELSFFHTARVKIAGTEVLALRHGMAGHQGVELAGPFVRGQAVREALLRAGGDLGLVQGGSRAYFSSGYESGWIGYPLPAIYTGDALRSFREWLPHDGWEAKYQLAGSFHRPRIEEYYVTPYDLGYDRIVKFNHDFVGREALEAVSEAPPRRKVTLVWNKDDVVSIFRSLLEPGLPYRYLELPVSDYGFPQRDEVQTVDGSYIGQSTLAGYTYNERDVLSLAFVEQRFAEPGTEVILVWGEPDGGSRKPHVERHRQLRVRATVAPCPYPRAVQSLKRATV